MNEAELENFKHAFLEKYNPSRDVGIAVSKSINAAVQHNSLYLPSLNQKTRREVRQYWGDYLLKLIKEYSVLREEDFFLEHIKSLQVCMNEKYSFAFRDLPHPRFQTDPGFRISHSQKSISVFLKHLWCMNHIKRPPQCPVDAIILSKAGHRYPDTKWGFVNSIEIHQAKISLLKSAKNDVSLPLAYWELKAFKIN